MTADTDAISVPDDRRAAHRHWLLEVTPLPTVAGRERRVVEWVRAWADEREGVAIDADATGNLTLSLRDAPANDPPVYFTAHMDHPGFVVDRVVAPGVVELAFRGGVMPVFFEDAPVTIHTEAGTSHAATLTGKVSPDGAMFPVYSAELDGSGADIGPRDIATWTLPEAAIDERGWLHTNACDDLAALVAALAAFDELRLLHEQGAPVPDVRVLLTKAEEVGFVGALAACRDGTIPQNARVIALENSRANADAPIGGGPIVRVGDRLSVFDPRLTSSIAARAEAITGTPAQPKASETNAQVIPKWQRKLMSGGACEATVFCAHGLRATCLCLPLGAYHNMGRLDELQAGTYDADAMGPPRAEREHIALSDFEGLVDLLIACGLSLPDADPHRARLDRLLADRAFVLDEQPA